MQEQISLQEKVKKFNSEKPCHKKLMPTYARIMDIASEVGELAKEYLKVTKYGTMPFKYNDNFELEFGDVFYSVYSLAVELGVDAEKVLDRSILKYKTRIERKNSMSSHEEIPQV